MQRDASHGIARSSEDRQVEAAQAYPTDAKEREKARRKKREEKGETITVKKRKKTVENHHDDCGDDLSSLVGCVFLTLTLTTPRTSILTMTPNMPCCHTSVLTHMCIPSTLQV